MRILVITEDHLSEHMGGTRVYTHALNRALVEAGDEVYHLCYKSPLTAPYVVDGVRVLPAGLRKISQPLLGYALRWPSIVRFIFRTIRKTRPDCVFVNNGSSAQFLWLLAFRQRNFRLVYFVHAMVSHEIRFDADKRLAAVGQPGWRDRIRNLIAKAKAAVVWVFEEVQLRLTDSVVTMSQYDRSEIEAFHGRRFSEKIGVFPIGIDLSPYPATYDVHQLRAAHGLPLEDPVFVVVRRLAPRMGLENLVDAAALLGDCEFQLLICGKGELADALGQRVAALGLGDKVRLLGFVSDEDKVELLCAADAVVLPTEELEGFGILILESLAANKPIIGTPVGAIPETLVKVDERLLTRGTDGCPK